MSRGRGDEGFTLLELVVTVTVLGIVLLVAAPAFPGPAVADDAEAVRRVLRRGAATAARFDRPVSVSAHTETGTLQLRLGDSVLSHYNLAEGGAASGSSAEVHFLPDGRASGGPIVLLSPEGSTMIHIDPWTSQVTMERSR
jgi:prepilin-type N-terminal cleavage/methylation domain-containing protein